jgi:hypothetical protein
MKHLSNVLLAISLLFVVVFGFMLFWQKQQNEHNEKMVVQLNEPTTEQTVITLPVVPEQKAMRQKIKDGVQSILAYILGIFSKI